MAGTEVDFKVKAGMVVNGTLNMSDNNITNVGQISLDAITSDANDMSVKLTDNRAAALNILQGSDSYMKFVTTTNSESIILSPEPNSNGVCKVVIGDNAAEDTMLVFDGAEINYRLGIDDSANQFEIGLGDAHDTTPVIVMDNAGNIIQLGQDSTPSSGEVLAWDGSKWTAAASASGADGMGSGFVLEDDSGDEVTIDENKEVKFIGAGITTNWTDTSTGSNTDPYDLTFTLDVDGVSAAAIASGDLVPFADTSDAGNATRKESIDDIATLFAGAGLTATNAVIAVDADQSGQITAVGTLTGLTVSGAADLNNNLTVDGATISLDATTSLNIDNSNTSNGISIGTATSGVPITIGHGTSEVTFGDNVTITGNLTVNGEQTVINSTAIVAEDKSMVLGIAGGMEDATYERSGSNVVTVTSSSHGFSNGEYVYVSNMGNSIADGVYTVSSVATNTFVLDSHGTTGVVGAGATMQHSSANVTEGTADGSGIFAPGTSLHSIQYDSSNGWTVSDDLDLVSGKHLSINGATTLSATTLGGAVVSSSLTTVGALDSGSIATGFGTISTESAITTTAAITGGSLDIDDVLIDGSTIGHTNDTDLITLANGLVTVAGEISVTTLDIGGTNVTSNAGELNLLDGSSAGTVVNSKAVIYSSAGQVKANTVSVDAIAVLDTSTATGQSWSENTAQTVASYAFGTFRTAKFVCQISDGTDFDVAEVLVTYKGASAPANDAAVYLTTYAYIGTAASDLGSFDAVKGTTTIDLKFTPATGNGGTYSYNIVNTVLVK